MKSINEIIKGLRACADMKVKCKECPYDELGNKCSEQMKKDAADVLEGFLTEDDDLK